MLVENKCTKRVWSAFMLGPKPSYPRRAAVRTTEESIEIHTKQHNGQRPPSLTETRMEEETPGAFNHQSIDSFRATVGLRPVGCALVVGQRPEKTYNSCSFGKFRSCVRPPASHRWYVIVDLMRRIQHDFRLPKIRRVGHAEARPLSMDF